MEAFTPGETGDGGTLAACGASGRRGGHSCRRRDLVLQLTATAFGLSRRRLTTAGRDAPHAVFARQVAMYLLHVVFSLPMQEVGALLRRDRSTVAHACRVVEERRETAAFDAFLHDLELAASALDSAIMLRTNGEYQIIGAL